MKFPSVLIIGMVLFSHTIIAQDDLLNELEEETSEQVFEQPAFKAMKIGNLQSTKLAGKGDLYMYVSHRFGALKEWDRTFFGFDNANTKLQLFYGITDAIQAGIGRESVRKAYSGHAKVRFAKQSGDMPVNVVGYTTVNIRTDLQKEFFPRIEFIDRLSYAHQLLISRRLSNSLSLEIAPTYVAHNLVREANVSHRQMALGTGGRIKLSKRMSLNLEYSYNFSRPENSGFIDPFAVGLDIETGGHVFQLLFTNSQSTNAPNFVSYADGYTYFGFNIVRVF